MQEGLSITKIYEPNLNEYWSLVILIRNCPKYLFLLNLILFLLPNYSPFWGMENFSTSKVPIAHAEHTGTNMDIM